MRLPLFLLLFLLFTLSLAATTLAHGEKEGVTREKLVMEALPNVPGHNLTAITVELSPGHIAAAHRHEAFLFVYVLSGRVRSQLDDEPAVDYAAGDTWIEPPGSLHGLTQNLSKTEPARLLVVFVRKEGTALSSPVSE